LSNPQVFYSDPKNTIGTVMCTFDAVVEENKITWPRLQWLFEYMCDLFKINSFFDKYLINLYLIF